MYTNLLENAYAAEIAQIVGDLYRTMLETEISPTVAECCPRKDVITALVSFSGDWKGTLALECGKAQALHFAQRLMQSEALEESNEDVRDALGELANIIAGNLKAVLPVAVSIGVPWVIEGEEYHIRFSHATVVGHSAFATDVGEFSVKLIEAERGRT